MTKVIRFSKLRYIVPAVSVALIVAGILITFLVTGINLGIDFRPGVVVRLQIAPVAFTVSYSESGSAEINIKGQALTLELTGQEDTAVYTYPFSEYMTLDALAQAVSEVKGVAVDVAAAGTTETAILLPLNYPYTLSAEPVVINQSGIINNVTIQRVRSVLESFGNLEIQMIGASVNQEFQVRVQEREGARDFDQEVSSRLTNLLETEYGAGTVLIRQTDYVGARLSQNLAQQTIYLTSIALALILIYAWFRFKLAYAIAAVVALVHDALFMLLFVAVTGMEFSTATIAAILTIIGYSINDTIVIFDRVRENTGLMRGVSFREIVDTSMTQTLGRTLMTALTTLLAIVALYIFTTGSIKDFALTVIFGVVEGTYSTVFIASPILMGWIAVRDRRKRVKDAEHYGTNIAEFHTEAKEGKSETKAADRGPVEIPVIERKLKGKRRNK